MPNKPFNIDKSDYEEHLNDRGKYFRVPNEIWVVQVDAFARIIWMYIFSQKPTWPSSMKNIARNLGMHEDTVKKHLRRLEEVKMIVVDRSCPKGWRFYIPPVSKWKDDLGEVEERYSKILAASDGTSPKFGAQVEKQPQITGPIKDYPSSDRLGLERKEKLLYPLECKETESNSVSSPKNQEAAIVECFLSDHQDFDLLKQRKGRNHILPSLVEALKKNGLSERESLAAVTTIVHYAIPSSTKRTKKIKEWRMDLEAQWRISVNQIYSDDNQKMYSTSQSRPSSEALEVNINQIFNVKGN